VAGVAGEVVFFFLNPGCGWSLFFWAVGFCAGLGCWSWLGRNAGSDWAGRGFWLGYGPLIFLVGLLAGMSWVGSGT
jgi:hypothetical protein